MNRLTVFWALCAASAAVWFAGVAKSEEIAVHVVPALDIEWEPSTGPVDHYDVLIIGRDAVVERVEGNTARVVIPWEHEVYEITVVAWDEHGNPSLPSEPLIVNRAHDCDWDKDGICGFGDVGEWFHGFGMCVDQTLLVACH